MQMRGKCKYNKECSVYQGIDTPENMSLMIYKNVFCNRGEKGWSGCKKYEQLTNNLSNSK